MALENSRLILPFVWKYPENMKIGIDISPVSSESSGHKVRGVGSYINLLIENLLKYDKKNEYTFFSKREEIPIDCDLIHYPYFDPFFVTIPFHSKYKTIVTIHDLTPIVFKQFFPVGIKGTIRWNTQKLLLRKVPHIITDSQSSKRDIVKYARVDENTVSVVYLSVSDIFKPVTSEKKKVDIQKKYNLPKRYLLYVGDVTWNKNLPRIIEAVKKRNSLPLVIVGKTITLEDFDKKHPWNQDLVTVQQQIDNNDLFHRLGFVDTEDLPVLYSNAECLLMPSLYEGFGLPVLEAMSCSCPVITSKAGSLPEVGGEAVLYVDETNTDSIIAAIKQIETEKKLREDLSKKGLMQAKKFSVKKTILDTVAVYENS